MILVRSTCSYGIQFYFTLAKNENTKNKGDELLVLPSTILFCVWSYDFLKKIDQATFFFLSKGVVFRSLFLYWKTSYFQLELSWDWGWN